MPPKKKGKKGKKGKKDGDEGGPPGGDKPGSGKELNELSKEFFLIQIKDLEHRLVRYVFLNLIVNKRITFKSSLMKHTQH